MLEDARQRGVLESYLLDPQRSEAELPAFTGLSPSGNFMVSDNLLTRVPTPSGETLARQDREALRAVSRQINDPRFENSSPASRRGTPINTHSTIDGSLGSKIMPHGYWASSFAR
jgi:hypothetical protein